MDEVITVEDLREAAEKLNNKPIPEFHMYIPCHCPPYDRCGHISMCKVVAAKISMAYRIHAGEGTIRRLEQLGYTVDHPWQCRIY